jgi:hypothetical protein
MHEIEINDEELQRGIDALQTEEAQKLQAAREAFQQSGDDDDPLYSMPLEELRAKITEQQQAEHQKTVEEQVSNAAQTFVDAHPEYVACPENLSAITDYLSGAGKETPTLEDIEQAYSTLRKKNRIRIDAKAEFVNKQTDRYVRAIAQANAAMEDQREWVRAHNPETMDIDELRAFIHSEEVKARKKQSSGLSY